MTQEQKVKSSSSSELLDWHSRPGGAAKPRRRRIGAISDSTLLAIVHSLLRLADGQTAVMRAAPVHRGRVAAGQVCTIGYFAKISSTRLNAFSAATCGGTSFFMISAQPVCHTCSFWTCA